MSKEKKDYLVRGIDKGGNFRFFGANSKNLVNEACQKHQTTPVASAALGRALTANVMMGSMLKRDQDRVSIIIKGDGPIGGIITESNGKCEVKGYVYHPQIESHLNYLGKLDVGGAVGNANMTVVKDLGMKEPYSGQVPMLTGEIAEDLTYYFAVSEQTNSVVILGVLVDVDYSIKQAGGIIIQVLPDAKEEAIDALEEKLKDFGNLTDKLEKGQSIEYVIEKLLGEVEYMGQTPISFHCDCNKDRMERALISVGKKDLHEIAEEDGQAELVCPFCNDKYLFNKEELEDIIKNI
ncbi:MAG: Hsp33 family molecular chaperone HslO [Cellulosilyticum sp.]|nr:Hsp33 family molecular chaperone HslO [Cellulosilyticum sp.]